jgi:voltage-gated potassium channel
VAVFTVEYLLRLWSAPESGRFTGAIAGRLRFALTPLALVDLFAVLPAYLPMLGVDLRVLRGVRLVRIVRILKLARYSRALRSLGRAFRRRREELVVTFSMIGLVVLIASSVMYYAEHPVQPEAFGSIPESLWWGVVTLTTLGYGDVVPMTVLGRVMGGIFALSGLLLVALPTAILGSAFVQELDERERRSGDRASARCPPGASPGPGRTGEDPVRCPRCGGRLDGPPRA